MQDRSLLVITCVVLIAHASMIAWVAFVDPSLEVRQPPVPRRFVVQTIELHPPEPQMIAAIEPELPPDAPLPSPPLEEIVVDKTPEKTFEPPPATAPPKPAESKPLPKPEKKAPPKQPEKKAAPKKAEPSQKTPQKTEPIKKALPKATPKPEVKKPSPPKKPPEKSELQKKKEGEEQAARERKQKLLEQAQERIAKIVSNKDKITAKSGKDTLPATPKAITHLQIDTLSAVEGAVALSDREIGYRDELAGRLKLLLRLPEYGDVKIKLTLERSGKVADVAIVSSENAANSKYIEKKLPEISFPAFGGDFGSAQQYTFSITLSNEL